MSRTGRANNILTQKRNARLNMRVPQKVKEKLFKLHQERKRESLKYHTETDIVLMALENYFILMGEPFEDTFN